MIKIKIIGTLADYAHLLTEKNIDEVVFAIPLKDIKDANYYISFAEEIGVNIRILPDWQLQELSGYPQTASLYYDQFIGLPTIALSSVSQKETELLLKNLIDFFGSLLGLVILSPLLLIIAVLVKLSSEGRSPHYLDRQNSPQNEP
ncbi:MAG: nucleoside-diphosphate sugar epimerase/dehydratase [Thermodesulfobacteriota bacterium]